MDNIGDYEVVDIMKRQLRNYNINCCLVGGAVRDIILEREPIDFDFTAEVNEKQHFRIAEEISKSLNCEMIYNHFYHTAKFLYLGYDIDFVMARRESYDHIAAKPEVKSSNLYDDLIRRDFTVNSMAVPIYKNTLRDIIDPFNGMKDIKDKKLRVLHDKSFRDDPTRIFRGIKYGVRFGFRFDDKTEELIYNAVDMGYINHLSSDRIKDEIKSILNEENFLSGMGMIKKYGILDKLINEEVKFNLNTHIRNFDNISYNDKIILMFYENTNDVIGKLSKVLKLNSRSIVKIQKLNKIKSMLNEKDDVLYRYLIQNARDLSSELLECSFKENRKIQNFLDNRGKLSIDISTIDDIKKEDIREYIIHRKIEVLKNSYGG